MSNRIAKLEKEIEGLNGVLFFSALLDEQTRKDIEDLIKLKEAERRALALNIVTKALVAQKITARKGGFRLSLDYTILVQQFSEQ